MSSFREEDASGTFASNHQKQDQRVKLTDEIR